MLEYLRIRNLALIADAELEFDAGLNVLSGETGAGKSFLLKAIGFAVGEKMSADMVRPDEEKAVVEALFSVGEDEYIIRRELAAGSGRSRLFLNDSLVSLDVVKQLRPNLLIHASQHGQQKLLQPAYQAELLDAFLDDLDLPAQKNAHLETLRRIGATLADLHKQCATLEDRKEILEFQRQQIEKVNPKPGEEDELLARRDALRNMDRARECLDRLLGRLLVEDGLIDGLADSEKDLHALADTWPELSEDATAVESARHHLSDLAARLRNLTPDAAEDNIEAVEKRLWDLAQLKRKLKRPLDEIVALAKEVGDNLTFLDVCGLDIKRLEREESQAAETLGALLLCLNAARRSASERLAQTLSQDLVELGFSDGLAIDFEFTPKVLYTPAHGEPLIEDRARLLFAPNPGQPAMPLDKIASGGELSRFLLAVIGRMAEHEQPALIFDEVDAGIGGITLGKVGRQIQRLADRQQVILISHWPQLAALGNRHFLVEKSVADGRTTTSCRLLNGKSVTLELARMAGGGDQGQALAAKLKTK
ncbi:DNA repair protein RecN [Desulfovibrio inopinatus]|uniref:DNA repair protein RecN n=1 Tax=Desulfovibrio inopinatus TaxID=102109 RepID=UPI0004862D1E|nr:AAA family ATPase [Desulfovibrio inopinatus]